MANTSPKKQRGWTLPPFSEAAIRSEPYRFQPWRDDPDPNDLSGNRLTIHPIAAARDCDAARMRAVGVDSPPAEALSVLRWILAQPTKGARKWLWLAQKGPSRGNVRTSLAFELNMLPQHLSSRGIGPLLKTGVVEIVVNAQGRELIRVTALGKEFFTELRWRHDLRNALDDDWLEYVRAGVSWDVAALNVAKMINEIGLDFSRAADIRFALRECDKRAREGELSLKERNRRFEADREAVVAREAAQEMERKRVLTQRKSAAAKRATKGYGPAQRK